MNELVTVSSKNLTIYAHVLNSDGQRWNGTAFETFSVPNYGNYDITMTEQGDTGVYIGDFPTGITASASYQIIYYRRLGGSPADGDPVSGTGTVDWSGTQVVAAGTGSMSGSDWRNYVLRRGFKRTDKDTELYEATTDAIQEMRRRFMFDEAEADETTTDTISVLGDYKLDVEDDFGLLLNIILEDDDTGTVLNRISKAEYDRRYPSVSIDTDRGYPKDYTVYAGQIYIGPPPDQTDYLYRMSYSRRAGAITADTVGVPFTNLYRDVLADNVLSRLYADLEEYDKSGFYKQRFEEGFLMATRRENLNAARTTFVVKPTNC